jgi:hypothetical protein
MNARTKIEALRGLALASFPSSISHNFGSIVASSDGPEIAASDLPCWV